MATLVGQGFERIGTRFKPGQTQAEFYDTQGDQVFGDPNSLASFVNSNYGRNDVNAENVFGVLSQGFTPRAQALDQITNQLNQQQNQTFQEQQQPAQRKSSSLADSIASEQGNYDTYLKEYNDLKTKLNSFAAPNYQDQYNQLRTSSGIPGIENDFANNQKSIRELPYVNRMNSGNAGVMTEGQLGADTQQKGIPLEIQQGNLLDRLKLAQDFINNSLKFKEMDSNAARQSLSDGINAALQTIDLSRTHLNDLLTQQKTQQERDQMAQQFAYDNRITQPFYDIGGTVYRTSDRMPAHNPQEYVAMGGKGDFSDVQKIDLQKLQQQQTEQSLVTDLAAKYADAGISSNDSLATAQSKLQNSKIYKEQVRPPSSGGGGGAGLSTAQMNSTINQIAQAFDNEPIVKEYNTIAQTFNALQNAGSTPTDDIQRIYAFAKVMDPNSAVREGEYKTVQDYATSLLQKYGLNSKRVFTNSGFLTDEARGFLSNTLQNRLASSQKAYDNVANEYQRRISDVQSGNFNSITNYSSAFPSSTNTPAQSSPQPQAQEDKPQGFWGKVTNWLFGN